jgi:hypothetical protein
MDRKELLRFRTGLDVNNLHYQISLYKYYSDNAIEYEVEEYDLITGNREGTVFGDDIIAAKQYFTYAVQRVIPILNVD